MIEKLKKAREILETEKKCVEIADAGCKRNCAECSLVKPAEEILEAYSTMIQVLDNLINDVRVQTGET